MTGAVAVAVAAAAAVLSLVLLTIVVRQKTRVRELAARIDDFETAQRESAARIEEVLGESRDSVQRLELALRPPAESAGSSDDDENVSVITDITGRLRGVDGDDDDLTTARIASVTLGGPLIKVAAFSHGVRHALDEEERIRISYAVRKELRRQRKIRRRRRRDKAPSEKWG